MSTATQDVFLIPPSAAQERLWLLHNLEPEAGTYNIPAAVRLLGSLDVEALDHALSAVVERHEILRTTFVVVDGEVLQAVHPQLSTQIYRVDLRCLLPERARSVARRQALAEAKRPFELDHAPLWRLVLAQIDAAEHVLLVTMHHTVSDGWSRTLFIREMSAFYHAHRAGKAAELEPLPIQYADYALWQREHLANHGLDRELDFWRRQLADLAGSAPLPGDLRPPVVTGRRIRAASLHRVLSGELTEAVRAFSRDHRATLFMTLLATLYTLLWRLSGHRDLTVGTPIAGRQRRETQGLIGVFLNTLVLRVELSSELGFGELVERVKLRATEAYAHQELPFEKLVEALAPERGAAAPFFQVFFNMLSFPSLEIDLEGLRVESLEPVDLGPKFDLTVYAEERPEGIALRWMYDADLFSRDAVAEMLRQYEAVLKQGLARPERRLVELALDTPESRAALPDSRQVLDDRFRGTFGELLRRRAGERPSAPAVEAGEIWSYADLDAASNGLARRLRQAGVGRGDRVAIYAHRSASLVVALCGVLRSGAAFAIFDPTYPAARLAFMAQLAVPKAWIVLAGRPLPAEFAAVLSERPESLRITLPEERTAVLELLADTPGTPVEHQLTADDLAYVAFTSGSTGQPKCVLGRHGSLTHFLPWQRRTFELGARDRFSLLSGLAHDPLHRDVFLPLQLGATVVVPDPETFDYPQRLVTWLARQEITVANLTPAMVRLLSDSGRDGAQAPALRWAFLVGDVLTRRDVERLRQLAPAARPVNFFGSTETQQALGHCRVSAAATDVETVPLGRGIDGVQLLVLDRLDRLAGVGELGEICFRSPHLALGYHAEPALTAERFTVHPFPALPGERIYRTGDLGRYRADGAVAFAGRVDLQVQIRGFRVEPAEIETALARHPAISEAVAVAREREAGEAILVAYLVLVPDHPLPPDVELRRFLGTQLPSHMVPAAFVALGELPLTPNGKLDLRALPDPPTRVVEPHYVPPRSPIEEHLTEIWSSVLGVDRVGAHDDFFALGGHSLLATQVLARVRSSLEVELPLRVLFDAPELSALAAEVEKARSQPSALPPIERSSQCDVAPLSHAQERIWFVDQLEPGTPNLNLSIRLALEGPLDVVALHRSLTLVVSRHDVLRAVIEVRDGRPFQSIAEKAEIPLPQVGLGGLPSAHCREEARRQENAAVRRSFDLEQGPLVRALLLRLAAQRHHLILVLHHMVADGWSIGVLFEELAEIYNAAVAGREPALPELPVQYADYAAWQRRWLEGEVWNEQLAYWRQHLADRPPALELPTDRPRQPVPTLQGARQTILLPKELTRALREVARGLGGTPFMVLLATFESLLFRYTGQASFLIGTPVAQRGRVEIERLIGMFFNLLALRADLGPGMRFVDLVKQVRSDALGAYAHQDLPFEHLLDALQPERHLSRAPLFQVTFVLQNMPHGAVALPGLSVRVLERQDTPANFDLNLQLSESPEGLRGSFEYRTDLFDPSTITALGRHFQILLAGVLEDPRRRLHDLPILSPAERHQLLHEWNDTAHPFDREISIPAWVQQQVDRAPESIAVSFADLVLSYGELDRRANQLARHLVDHGALPATPVAVHLERSPEMILAVLAILKAGAFYVPLDVGYPRTRLETVLETLAVRHLVTSGDLLADVAELATPHLTDVTCLGATPPSTSPDPAGRCRRWWSHAEIELQPATRPGLEIDPESIAYVIFTSGSTGLPKGVVVRHRPVVNLFEWIHRTFAVGSRDRLLFVTSLSFDLSVFDIFGILAAGGIIRIATRWELDRPEALARALRDEPITFWDSAPAALERLTAFFESPNEGSPPSALRRVFLSGDWIPLALPGKIWRAFPNAQVISLGGATEATVWSNFHPVTAIDPHWISIPYGRPIQNARYLILDARLSPCPQGVPGDLFIGGDCLADGYAAAPRLTAWKYLPDLYGRVAGARLYCTGDRARWRGEGRIEFLGRQDQQVKIRGHRIELGEIEAALGEHPAVRDAVVLAISLSSQGEPALGAANADRRLVAWVVPQATEEIGDPSAVGEQVDHWRAIYDGIYRQPGDRSGDFDTSGWISSFTGLPIPAEEMRFWVHSTVERILELQPQRVLEVGCGTGMLLFRLAPRCALYHATDLSEVSLLKIREELGRRSAKLDHVTLERRAADDWQGIEPGVYDTVIINSVTQHFPDADYLLRVLEEAVERVAPGGTVFVGDIRSLSRLTAFHAAVELRQAAEGLSRERLARRVAQRLDREEELVLDPLFFRALPHRLPRLEDVALHLKRGAYPNEMSLYRYDAVLRVGSAGAAPPPSAEGLRVHDWSGEESLDWLVGILRREAPPVLALRAVPDARLDLEMAALRWLEEGAEPPSVGEWRRGEPEASRRGGLLPEEVWSLAAEVPYSAEVADSAQAGCCDLLFVHRSAPAIRLWGTTVAAGLAPPAASDGELPWRRWANQPRRGFLLRQLIPRLRDHLAARLPESMLPSSIVLLDELPLTLSGKLDRRALPRPDDDRSAAAREFIAPRSVVETRLASIWSEVLGVDRLGIHDNFFTLGGDSILSIQVVTRAHEIGLRLSARQIFQHQTLAELAAVVETATAASDHPKDEVVSGTLPLTPMHHWFFEQRLAEPQRWNLALRFRIREELDDDALDRTVRILDRYHDALRLRFARRAEEWKVWNAAPDPAGVGLTVFDLSRLPPSRRSPALLTVAGDLQGLFHLERGPLWRVALFRCGSGEDRLLLACHHLVIDGVSWRILLEDFERVYRQVVSERPVLLPPKTTSYKDWAHRLPSVARSSALTGELADWLAPGRWSGHRPLPVDQRTGANDEASARSVVVTLAEQPTRALLQEAPRAYGTNVEVVLLTALGRAFAAWTGSRSLLLELEGHGRDEELFAADLSRTVGWFTAIFPIVLELGEHRDPGEELIAVKEGLRRVPRRGVGYSLLRRFSEPETVDRLASLPRSEVIFNYLGQLDQVAERAGMWSEPEAGVGLIRSGRAQRLHLFEIYANVSGGQLRVELEYSANRHRKSTVRRLAEDFLAAVDELVRHCLAVETPRFTPSDFPAAGLGQDDLDRLTARLEGGTLADIYRLSPLQEGMLFHTLYRPGAGEYVVHFGFEVVGPIDLPTLDDAWNRVVAHHGVLRSSFHWQGLAESVQVVHRQVATEIEELDWRDFPRAHRTARLEAFLREDRRRGFDSTKPPLMRLVVIHFGVGETFFLWSHHHLLLDGWSLYRVLHDVFQLYGALQQGAPPSLPPSRPYRDFITWLAARDAEAEKRFWRLTLEGWSAPTPLAVDRLLLDESDELGDHRIWLDGDHSAGFLAWTRQHQLTLNTLTQAAWALLRGRYSERTDVVFGTTLSGRPAQLRGVESMVGLFMNTLPVRVRWDETEDVGGFLQRLQDHLAEIRQHEHLSLSEVHRLSEIPAGEALFEDLLVFESFPIDRSLREGVPNLEVRSSHFSGQTNYPLVLRVTPGEHLGLQIVYARRRFERATVIRLLEHLRHLLDALVEDAGRRCGELSLLGLAERHQLLVEGNDTARGDRPGTLHELFADQARRTPDRLAVVFGATSLSFRELDRRSTALARRFRELRLSAEGLVGIHLERCLEMVIAILATLKADAAYLPLDPRAPTQRLATLLEDARPAVLVTCGGDADGLADTGMAALRPDDFPSVPEADCQHLGPSRAQPESAAYVLFTSGSTGRPKGVVVEHRQVVNYVMGIGELVSLEPGSWAALQPLAVDSSVTTIHPPLLTGGTLFLVEEAHTTDAGALARAFRRWRPDVLKIAPSHLQALGDAGQMSDFLPRRDLLIGGEASPRDLFVATLSLLGDGRLFNHYGPTETTVGVLMYPAHHLRWCPPGNGVPLGRPLANAAAWIVDRAGRPVPIGAPGELWLGGRCLARGYLGRPARTAERFLADGFSGRMGERLYRTGDRAHRNAAGVFEFLGRIDHQVKIRGFRIEPGEVSAQLAGHEKLRQAIVLPRREAGKDCLTAFVVPWKEPGPQPAELAAYLAERLPDAMVPSAFVTLAELPRSRHGKVDLGTLEALTPATPTSTATTAAPRGPIEEALATIWSELLKRQQVGAHDDFFELGGHSLLAMRIVSRIGETFQIELPVRALFEAPTVAGLGARIQAALGDAEAGWAPLERVPRNGDALPVSFAQERLWFLHQLDPGSTAYNIPVALRLSGRLDLEALGDAVAGVIARHEVLRTRFLEVEGRATQQITSEVTLARPLVDLSACPAESREGELARWGTAEAARPFDLGRAPLLRLVVLRLGATEHAVLFTLHHIVSDAWSAGILVHELNELYTAGVLGQKPRLEPLPIQYADFTVWQRRWLTEGRMRSQLEHWRQRLAGAAKTSQLPIDRPRPAIATRRGASAPLRIPESVSAQLTELGRRTGTTLFMVLLAAFTTQLHRLSRQNNVVVGSPIANRGRVEIEGLIGFFVNTLALRVDLQDRLSFAELLHRVRETTLAAYAHQDLPFERLVDELEVDRDLSHAPLFQMVIALQNAPTATLELPSLTCEPVEISARSVKFDATLFFRDREDGIRGVWEYNRDLFDPTTVRRFSRQLAALLRSAATNSEQRLGDLPLLADGERFQLLREWNVTRAVPPLDVTLIELFELQADQIPDAVAVEFGGHSLTYQQLETQGNRLAHRLRKKGVGPEVAVGINLERSLEMVVALVATLKAGGFYVPLEPHQPQERLSRMVADARVAVLIARSSHADALPVPGEQRVLVDAPRSLAEPGMRQQHGASPANLAYTLFTSGSTGRPKGAMISHGGIVNQISWLRETYRLGAGDRILQKTPFGFDVSVWELFAPLISGARLVMAKPDGHKDSHYLAESVRRCGITLMHFVPSMMRAFLDEPELEASTSLRQMLVGGEALSQELMDRCRERLTVRLDHLYGPTEATIDVTAWPCQERRDRRIPIGRPIANLRAHILDRRFEPLPIGVGGELHLGGVGVARGYSCRPATTAERFVPDPHAPAPGERLYRTGDVGRILLDGEIELLGRLDRQVKLRGYRIELGEIEAILGELPGVAAAAVVVDEQGTRRRLAAYVAPVDSENDLDLVALRRDLGDRLPEHMVPAVFVTLDALPQTASGKLDRRRLPAIEDTTRSGAAQVASASRTEVEKILESAWSEVLMLEEVGLHDNFFELGGDSIVGLQMLARTRAAGLRLTPRQLFRHQTIAGLAAVAEIADPSRLDSEIEDSGEMSAMPIQCWFDELGLEAPHHYNQAVLLTARRALDTVLLERALERLVGHHDVLRLCVTEDRRRVILPRAQTPPTRLLRIDLSVLPPAHRCPALERAAATVQASLDLTSGLLLRTVWLTLGPGELDRFLIVIHHLAVDGVSWRVLLEDLQRVYRSLEQGAAPALPPKTTSIRRWAELLERHARSDELRAEASFWRDSLSRATGFALPVATTEEQGNLAPFRRTFVEIDSEDTEILLHETPKLYRAQMREVLLAALTATLTRWSGQPGILVDLEGHGRVDLFEDVDLSRTVGWFTVIHPVVLEEGPDDNPGTALRAVRDTLLAIPHDGIGYGLLRYLSGRDGADAGLGSLPRADILFNYLGQADPALPSDGLFGLAEESAGATRRAGEHRPYRLEISALVSEGRLRVRWSFSSELDQAADIEAWAQSFADEIRRIVEHCRSPTAKELVAGDFPDAELSQEELENVLLQLG